MLLETLAALSVLAPSAAFASFDPTAYTTDATLFSDLSVQDFQSFTPSYWTDYPETAPLVIDDLAYWGTLWPDNGWCIPGMDSGPYCGGTNVYLASAVDIHIVPLVPIDRIGFRYGTQGSTFTFEVTLSDGSVHTFFVSGSTDASGWSNPATGFFGYGTGDASLTLEHIHLQAMDGGIDDMRYGVVQSAGACDDLAAAIRALALPAGIERSLVAKVEASERLLERGQLDAAIHLLEALLAELDAQSGVHVDPADADALAACVEARIDELL